MMDAFVFKRPQTEVLDKTTNINKLLFRNIFLNISCTQKSVVSLSLCSVQDRAEGEWGELASTTFLRWIPKCITGLTPWTPAKDTSGELYQDYMRGNTDRPGLVMLY